MSILNFQSSNFRPLPFFAFLCAFASLRLIAFCLPFLVFICFQLGLFASLEQHFKPCLHKSDNHQMENVDFIYMINLDHRTEKFLSCTEQLHPYGIFPYRFSAIYGKDLSFEALDDIGVRFEPWMKKDLPGTYYSPEDPNQPRYEKIETFGHTYFAQSMAKGTIGCVLSHLSILQDAYDAGYETIWLMEDDIQVVQDPRLISSMIIKLDALVGEDAWDLLYTDRETKDKHGQEVHCLGYGLRPNYTPPSQQKLAEKRIINADFRKIGARYGTYSMIIRRSGIKKLLDFFKTYKIFLPYDFELALPSDMNLYTLASEIVSTQPTAISDNDAPPLGVAALPFHAQPKQQKKATTEMLQILEHFDGWCTNAKASLLMDLVLITKPKTVVEIGVFGGKSLIPIALALQENGTGTVYGIDPWNPVESGKWLKGDDREWWMNLNHQLLFENLNVKITQLHLNHHTQLIRATSANANLIQGIDLLNIDGNHAEHTTYFDVRKWVPCVRKGGIIILNLHSNSHTAVKWLNEHCIKFTESDGYPSCGVWINP